MEDYRPVNVSDTRRVGLMGGTFDPVHYGHLVVSEEVRATLNLTEMVFVPAGHPPHKLEHPVTAVAHRLAMLELAIASNPYFSISRIEVERAGPSYTVDTLRQLRREWGTAVAMHFVIGWDGVEDIFTWYDPAGILAQRTHLVASRRPGYIDLPGYRARLEERLPGIDQRLLIVAGPQLSISSTDLRSRVAQGRPIKYQMPEAVEQYIAQHGLYRTM